MSDEHEQRGRPGPLAGAPGGKRVTQLTAPHGVEIRRIQKLRVTVVDGPEDGAEVRKLEIAQNEVTIGSDPSADLVLRDPSVSREHLTIQPSDGGWVLTDRGSTNGSFVGDLRIERGVARGPMMVRLGNTVLRLEPLGEHVEQEISSDDRFGRMLGHSPAMREMFAVLQKVAQSELTVLIEGETGTGKELAAEGLHTDSGRKGAFITLNCGAIPRELIESELLGHVEGAFTGAVRDRPGAFLSADGGTLFLDEVSELPLDMQAKLLRVLERREVKPVGSDKTRAVDVRVVAATNRTMSREVEAEAFRQDLYYRLAVVVVRSTLRWRGLVDGLAMLPLAVPGLVMAFGYLSVSTTLSNSVFVRAHPWLLELVDVRQNPTLLLVLAYSIRRLPYMVRAAHAGLEQTSRTYEEAAANLGASPWRVIRRGTLPLVAANLVAGAILCFAFSMLEVSDSLILAQSEQFYPITKAIFVLMDGLDNGLNVAAALGVWAMALLAAALLWAASLLGKKMGQMFRV